MSALAVLSLVVGACGDDDSNEAGNAGDDARNEEREPLPLQEWWTSFGGGDARQEVERSIETRVADCMGGQGFEYTPVESHPGADPATNASGPWNLSPQQFAERYGYGLFTIEDTPGIEDPNGARLVEMSASEQETYSEALWGEEGCLDTAWAGEFEGSGNDDVATIESDMDAMEEQIAEDKDVKDGAEDWASCMADAEFSDLTHPDDAVDLVISQFEELLPERAAFAQLESLPLPDGRLLHRMRGLSLAGADPEALGQLRDHEISVATADFDCRAAYDDARYDAQFELESQFVEDNAELLDRIAEAQGTGT